MNYLCNKRGILQPWVKWWLRFGNCRTKWIPCPMQENFTIVNQGAALERPTFLIKLLRFRVPEPCCAAILDCRVIHWMVRVLQETFLNDRLLKKDCPLRCWTIQRIWHHPLRDWDLILQKQHGERERNEKRIVEHVDSITSLPKWKWNVESYWWNLFSRWYDGLSDNSCYGMEFQSWKVNFRTEVCLRTADPQITMLWIKEVEIAKSIDELVTSRSITGQHNFPDFDMLDAVIASALKKLLNTQANFWKRVSVEEQRAQNSDRFLRGRQIAYMIYEYFRATGAELMKQYKDSQLCSLFSLQNDDVQDFDVTWDHVFLSVSEMPSDMILEGLYILFNFRLWWHCMIKKRREPRSRTITN